MSDSPIPSPSANNPLRDNIARSTDHINLPVSPEILIPRLGDYLLEKGLLTAEDLQRALDYQKANAIAGNPRLLGQILVELKLVDRATLDHIITEQILKLQRALKETNKQLERRVEERTQALQRRLAQIRTAAEITRLAIRSTHLDDLLRVTVNRIVEQFDYYYAAIFLVDAQGKYAVLREGTGSVGQELKARNYKLAVGSRSIIGWVTTNNQPRITTDVAEDDLYLQDELLPQTRSEACLPLSIGDEVVGALDVQSTSPQAFDEEDIVILQTLADQIASAIRNVRLLENAQVNLQEINLLYEASHRISQAESAAEIIQHAAAVFTQTSYASAVLIAEGERLRLHSLTQPDTHIHTAPEGAEYLPYSLENIQNALPRQQPYLLVTDFSQTTLPAALIYVPRKMQCEEIAYIPVWRGTRLAALFILGAQENGALNPQVIQPYISLAEFAAVALGKIDAIRGTQEQVSNLAVLNSVSQVIATETDLNRLYRVIHQQVSRVMGEVVFYIAIYDPKTNYIRIPYIYEDGETGQIEPIPLGEGLTSIVIRERKPLMLVEDTERRAAELGAKQIGKVAKSWLGVPLMVSGEVIGVMNVQNTEREHAFTLDDERLLSTLAAQVAVAIRNAHLIAEARAQAERQRRLYEATEKVRASLDIQTILETTSQELSAALGASRVVIELRPPTSPDGENAPPEDSA